MTVTYNKPAVRNAWADAAASPTDIVDPGDSFVAAGWLQSPTPPSRQRFNWILNYLGNAVRYFMQRGVSDWDPNETYGLNAVVLGDDGVLKQSTLTVNKGIAPSTNAVVWSPLTGYATNVGLGAYATQAFVQSYITSIQVVFVHAAAYYKIATLPAGIASTVDSIRIQATLNSNFVASGSCMFEGIFGNRGVFSYQYTLFGPNNGTSGIKCFLEADGTVSVYLTGMAYSYVYATITNVGNASSVFNTGPAPIIYPNPAPISTPSGTQVFNSVDVSNYPPLLYAITPTSYLTASQVASIYATITAAQGYASTAQTNSENYAASVANSAQIAAQTYAAQQAAAALAAAESFATNAANNAVTTSESYAAAVAATAQSNAIAAAEAYANGTGLFATNGWSMEPSGKINMWGFFPGQNSSPGTVVFPRSGGFPSACTGIQVTPVGQSSTYFISNPASSKTQFSLSFGASNTPFSWAAVGY